MKLLDDVWERVKKRLDDSAMLLVILVVVGAIAGLRGREVIAGEVVEQLAPVRRQVDEHQQKLTHQADDIHELGKDMRELYWVLPTLRRSERLEQPFPVHADDGGTP